MPEIHAGTVEIKAIAREAGSRSKVAVSSRQDGLDPVGATVGQRGARVQAVVAELGGEKIDIIPWNDDASIFVANALSPAQVISVDIDEEKRIANVTVPERMLSLAIGREGQNARLAARLTGWRIDIRSDVSVAAKAAEDEATAAEAAAPTAPETPVVAAPAAEAATAPDAEPAEADAASTKTKTRKAATTKTTATKAAKPATTKTAATKKAPATKATKEATAAADADANGATPAKKTRAKKATAAEEVAS